VRKYLVHVGDIYGVNVGGSVVPCRVTRRFAGFISDKSYVRWDAVNLITGRKIKVKSAMKLRELPAPVVAKFAKKSEAKSEPDPTPSPAAWVDHDGFYLPGLVGDGNIDNVKIGVVENTSNDGAKFVHTYTDAPGAVRFATGQVRLLSTTN
jgi:hypothetical protein